MSDESQFIAALDVGTTKICVLAAELDPEGELRILGIGNHPSRGLKKGEMVNLELAVDSIRKATEAAEKTCGRPIDSVFTGIAGSHVQSYNGRAAVPVAKPQAGIDRKDIVAAVKAAQKITLPAEARVLHVIPQDFAVDDRDGIINPLGLVGARLEARVHVVTVRWGPFDNILRAIRQAGLRVEDVSLQPLAASQAVLKKEEQQSGAVVVDIGGGTTDYVVFHGEAVRCTRSLPLGGDHVTNDVAVGMKILLHQAEEIKKKYGCSISGRIDPEDQFSSPAFGGRASSRLSRYLLSQIIELRMSEIFQIINRELDREGFYRHMASGMVLTGGASLLAGCCPLAGEIFPMPVRQGRPWDVEGVDGLDDAPVYSTAVGLLKMARSHRLYSSSREDTSGGLKKYLRGVKGWLNRNL